MSFLNFFIYKESQICYIYIVKPKNKNKIMQESKQNKLALLQQMIENAERNIVAARQIIRELNIEGKPLHREAEASQIVEGTFDGEKMVSMDGKYYPVPANYASKSKLVEGDILKLTITEDGSFVYKKISSVDTRKVIGIVMKDGNDRYYVNAEGKKYNVLLASLTYFKAEEGDEVILVVPKEKVSNWAAVESIIKEGQSSGSFAVEDEQKEFVANEFGEPEMETDFGGGQSHIKEEDDIKNAAIEDEWTPSVDEIKKEGGFDSVYNSDDAISDDFSN
jgi:bifunctional DNA-binding transcriptional regulator/antitoxin component of YhaV-PrlF toxin-antitoxin module